MADVNQEIQGILEFWAQAGRIQANAQSVSEQAGQRMNELRERIKHGETTGDRIKDFIIARYGLLSKEIEQVFRDLEARIGQHVGEFVLMITKEENFHGCTGFGYEPKARDFVLDEHLYLGVLRGGALVLNPADGECELPTGNHIRCWGVWRGSVGLVEGNITSGWGQDFGHNLNKQFKRRNPSFQQEQDLKLEVKIGDVEVETWFEKRGGHHLVVFQKASRLLGREIEESPQLAAELRRRREAVAKRLKELVQERDQSMGSRRKQGIESEIKRLLGVALELGMADAQLLSIQQLCQEYEVKAP